MPLKLAEIRALPHKIKNDQVSKELSYNSKKLLEIPAAKSGLSLMDDSYLHIEFQAFGCQTKLKNSHNTLNSCQLFKVCFFVEKRFLLLPQWHTKVSHCCSAACCCPKNSWCKFSLESWMETSTCHFRFESRLLLSHRGNQEMVWWIVLLVHLSNKKSAFM